MATRIMVINDTKDILELFRAILESEGYEVILYSYAIQDIVEVERIMPDLLIVDVIFGSEKLGWQMLDKLKMNRTTAAIPVIVCSAAINAVREMEGYLMSQGVSIVLKPFEIDVFLSAVKIALESRKHSATLVDDNTNSKTHDQSN
jgi:DNA-binding response OmpR family regulator